MLIIVGKNSQLYQRYQNEYNIECIEVSHDQLGEYNFSKFDEVVLFSYSKKMEQNTTLLSHLARNVRKIKIIGSAAVFSPVASRFNYSRSKLQQLNIAQVLSKEEGCSIAYGIFGSFTPIDRIGYYYKSDLTDLHDFIIKDCRAGIINHAKLDGTDLTTSQKKQYTFVNFLLTPKLAGVYYKIFTKYNYGYNIVIK